jgi:tetratricopeptide (TPR) repeat protein
MKRSARFFLFLMVFAAGAGPQNGAAQAHRSRLEQGVRLYRSGYWADAALELRRSRMEAANPGQLAESLYWLSLVEFSLGEYEAALRDLEELQRIAPAGLRIDNVLYYKARSLYYLNRHEEAFAVFRLYADLLERSKANSPQALSQKAAVAYWIGECLYSLGQQDQAAEFFAGVVGAKPRIAYYEAASYRLAMIRQNKLHTEILGMLDWSYSEYLRLTKEYQEREAAYNETIAAYQKQAAGFSVDAAHTAELEAGLAEHRRRLSAAEERIRLLELNLEAEKTQTPTLLVPGEEDAIRRVRELKAEANRLRDYLLP